MDIRERELAVMAIPVYLQVIVIVANVDCPGLDSFIWLRSLKQAAPESIWIFRSL